MLKPDYLINCSEGAQEIARQLEDEIIQAIVARIDARMSPGFVFQNDMKYLVTQTDVYRMQVLQDAGFLSEDIEKIIAEKTGLMYEEIRKAFLDAGLRSSQYDDAVYRSVGLNPPSISESPFFMRLMERNYYSTAGTWQNYTGTLAKRSQVLFIDTLDRMYNSVSMGAHGYSQAYYEAINGIIEQGPRIFYPSGHKDTIEVATLRALRTGISQMSAEITLGRMEEMNCNLVIVSSHADARPEHARWQGKIYSRTGRHKKYPDFVSSTGYGTGPGLCGWNCRHSFSPYFEGMDNPFEQYNPKKVDEAYEETQKQRELERRIRKTKRYIEVYKLLNPTDDADAMLEHKRNLLKKQMEAYNDYCDEHNLKPQAVRLANSKLSRDQALKSFFIDGADFEYKD